MMTRREKDLWNEALATAIERLIDKGFGDPELIKVIDCVKIKKEEFKRQHR